MLTITLLEGSAEELAAALRRSCSLFGTVTNVQVYPEPSDATVALGTRTMPLKFVLTKLDSFVGQRMSVSGMLIGTGGVDGINVAVVNRVAGTCP